jgi:hypothetical protein
MKRLIGRPRRWWEDNIKMEIEMAWASVNWSNLSQNGDWSWDPVNSLLNLWLYKV